MGRFAATALVLGGCSFIIEESPRTVGTPPQSHVECATHVAPIMADIAAAAFFLTLGLGVAALDQSPGESPVFSRIALVPLSLSALYIASTIYGLHTIHSCQDARTADQVASAQRAYDEAAALHALRERQLQMDSANEARRVSQQRAEALTKAAAAAARAGDCATVKTLDPQVGDVDPEFHDIVFVRDAAIARCLVR